MTAPTGNPRGRPPLYPRGAITRETRTRETIPVRDDQREKILDALRAGQRFTLSRFVESLWAVEGVDRLAVAKKILGRWAPVGDFAPGEVLPDELEKTILQQWGPAEYQLQPIHRGELVGGRIFVIGGEEAVLRSEPSARGYQGTLEDADQVLAQHARRASVLVQTRQLEALARGEDDMKPEALAQLITAIKGSAGNGHNDQHELLVTMWKAAEERNTRLVELLLQRDGDKASSVNGVLPAVLSFLQSVNPDVLERLLPGVREPEGGWKPADVLTLLQQLGPIAQAVLAQLAGAFRPAAPAPAPAAAAAALPMAPAAPGTGGSPTMAPIPLMPEQQMAVDLVLTWIREQDYASAYATLDATPGFSEAFLSRIDPDVNPKAYLPAVLAIAPAAKDMLAAVETFITYCQQRIRAEAKAAAAEAPTPLEG